jgi:hypothetical protein
MTLDNNFNPDLNGEDAHAQIEEAAIKAMAIIGKIFANA